MLYPYERKLSSKSNSTLVTCSKISTAETKHCSIRLTNAHIGKMTVHEFGEAYLNKVLGTQMSSMNRLFRYVHFDCCFGHGKLRVYQPVGLADLCPLKRLRFTLGHGVLVQVFTNRNCRQKGDMGGASVISADGVCPYRFGITADNPYRIASILEQVMLRHSRRHKPEMAKGFAVSRVHSLAGCKSLGCLADRRAAGARIDAECAGPERCYLQQTACNRNVLQQVN